MNARFRFARCVIPALALLVLVLCATLSRAVSEAPGGPPLINDGEAICGGVWSGATGGSSGDVLSQTDPTININHIITKCVGRKEKAEFFGKKAIQDELKRLKSLESEGKVRWSVGWYRRDRSRGIWGITDARTYEKLLEKIEKQKKIQRHEDKVFGGINDPLPWREHDVPTANYECGGGSLDGESYAPPGDFSPIVPPAYPGDIAAYQPELDDEQTWRARLPELIGERGRRVVEFLDEFDKSQANLPGAFVRYWWESVVAARERFLKPFRSEFSIREYWRRMKSSWQQARRLHRFLEDLVEEDLEQIQRNSETLKEAAEFSMKATETMESLMLPSQKSYLGTYKPVQIASIPWWKWLGLA